MSCDGLGVDGTEGLMWADTVAARSRIDQMTSHIAWAVRQPNTVGDHTVRKVSARPCFGITGSTHRADTRRWANADQREGTVGNILWPGWL